MPDVRMRKIERRSNCICSQQQNLGLNICTGLSQGPRTKRFPEGNLEAVYSFIGWIRVYGQWPFSHRWSIPSEWQIPQGQLVLALGSVKTSIKYWQYSPEWSRCIGLASSHCWSELHKLKGWAEQFLSFHHCIVCIPLSISIIVCITASASASLYAFLCITASLHHKMNGMNSF